MLAEVCCTIAAMGLHLGSVHVDPERWLERHGINNANTGAYVRFDSGLTVGTFRNTLSTQSVYAGWTWTSDNFSTQMGPLRVAPAVTVGAVSGYPRGVQPLVVPSVLVQFPAIDLGVRMAYLPKTKQTGAHVVHFMIERKF